MAELRSAGSLTLSVPGLSPLALALALVAAVNEQFDAEVTSVDMVSAEKGEIRIRVRPRSASHR